MVRIDRGIQYKDLLPKIWRGYVDGVLTIVFKTKVKKIIEVEIEDFGELLL